MLTETYAETVPKIVCYMSLYAATLLLTSLLFLFLKKSASFSIQFEQQYLV